MTGAETRFVAAGTTRFRIHRWTDGSVVFDRRSGDTHALDSFTADVLLASLSGVDPASLAARYPEFDATAFAVALGNALARLESLRLRDPVQH